MSKQQSYRQFVDWMKELRCKLRAILYKIGSALSVVHIIGGMNRLSYIQLIMLCNEVRNEIISIMSECSHVNILCQTLRPQYYDKIDKITDRLVHLSLYIRVITYVLTRLLYSYSRFFVEQERDRVNIGVDNMHLNWLQHSVARCLELCGSPQCSSCGDPMEWYSLPSFVCSQYQEVKPRDSVSFVHSCFQRRSVPSAGNDSIQFWPTCTKNPSSYAVLLRREGETTNNVILIRVNLITVEEQVGRLISEPRYGCMEQDMLSTIDILDDVPKWYANVEYKSFDSDKLITWSEVSHEDGGEK
ncbi:MAG: hypothetical protein QXU32_06865 [Nitrososphaerales archaeon]